MFVPGGGVGGGVLEAVLIWDYTGDGTNNRAIDLGDEYDYIEIRPTSDIANTTTHAVRATALGDGYTFLYNYGSSIVARHKSGAQCDAWWEGKMTGADATKIRLGTNGANAESINRSGTEFRIVAFKFSTVTP